MEEHKKNIVIALLLGALVWLGLEILFKPSTQSPSVSSPVPQVDTRPVVPLERPQALSLSARIPIETPWVLGSISLSGARLDDWVLKTYGTTPDPQSTRVDLLSPQGTKGSQFARFEWYAHDESDLDLPHGKTLWSSDRPHLEPHRPLTLSWKNGKGLVFELILTATHPYGLTVVQKVTNHTDRSVTLGTCASFMRSLPQKNPNSHWLLHEGAIGVFAGQLREKPFGKSSASSFDPLTKERFGWVGITDKYWLSALIPTDPQAQGMFETHQDVKVTARSLPRILAPGESHSAYPVHVFCGPKQLALLQTYEKDFHIDHFDLAVDFGWFYFLTKPMLVFLSWLKEGLGNFGLAILMMTVALKLVFFPLSLRSYRAMARLKKFQPQIEQLKERYSHDKMKLNQSILELYRKEKINPASGCLPMLVQIPVFFALYKVLFVSIEMHQAPFWGWISDLSAPDPTSLLNGFGLFSWPLPESLQIGIWPLLMGVTMWLQQRMNTAVAPMEPAQKIMLTYGMPVLFTFMLARFPVGLVIYWTWNNLLTFLQQWTITYFTQKDG